MTIKKILFTYIIFLICLRLESWVYNGHGGLLWNSRHSMFFPIKFSQSWLFFIQHVLDHRSEPIAPAARKFFQSDFGMSEQMWCSVFSYIENRILINTTSSIKSIYTNGKVMVSQHNKSICGPVPKVLRLVAAFEWRPIKQADVPFKDHNYMDQQATCVTANSLEEFIDNAVFLHTQNDSCVPLKIFETCSNYKRNKSYVQFA